MARVDDPIRPSPGVILAVRGRLCIMVINRLHAYCDGDIIVPKRAQTVIGTSSPSDLEQTLLRLAYNGPVEKWDLIERLYPAGGDSLALENRFKNLVARVRKKYPSLLTCHEGRYSVARLPAVHDLL